MGAPSSILPLPTLSSTLPLPTCPSTLPLPLPTPTSWSYAILTGGIAVGGESGDQPVLVEVLRKLLQLGLAVEHGLLSSRTAGLKLWGVREIQ